MIQNEAEYLDFAKSHFCMQCDLVKLLDEACHFRNEEIWAEEVEYLRSQIGGLREEMKEYDATYRGDRKGSWMPIHSGNRFWPEDPRPDDIRLEDIAHSLANTNRFNGHTREAYSVAQHAVLVSYIVRPEYAKFALHHDDGEAYLGDVISPVKKLFRHFYEGLEEAVMRAVAEKFEFTMDKEARNAVKKADLILLSTEARDLTNAGFLAGPIQQPPLPLTIHPLGAKEAERLFIQRFAETIKG